MALTNDQVQRYSRHLIMPEVGVDGQEKLLNSKILLIGAGGLGSPLGLYLAAAGVGTSRGRGAGSGESVWRWISMFMVSASILCFECP